MASPLARLFVSIGLDSRDFSSGIARVKGDAKAMGTVVGAVAGTAAIGALKIGDAYKDATNSIRIGTGLTGQALADVESQFKAVAGRVPDDIGVVAQTLADLQTRTGLSGDALGKLGESILDISRLTGGDAVANVANLTRLYGDWSIAAEDQVETNDRLLRASQATGITLDALTQKVVQFGAPMRGLNLSFDQSIALLGKWEKEGVNTETLLSGMRLAYDGFVKQGIDPQTGLPALIKKVGELSDEEGYLAVKQVVGARAANDFFRAIKEGRFDVTSTMDAIANGTDTVQGLADETRDAGDVFKEIGNRIATFVGPATSLFSGLSEAMGNAIYLLPAVGGLLGRGLGALWQKAGGSGAVKAAVGAAGAAAGVVYNAAAFAASKIMAAAVALWGMMGGGRVLAAAGAAGVKAGAAYAGASAAGGMLGTIARAASMMAPIAIPVAVAWVASEVDKPVTDAGKSINKMLTESFDTDKGMLYGTIFDSLGDGLHEGWNQMILNDPFSSEETKAALRKEMEGIAAAAYDPLSSITSSARDIQAAYDPLSSITVPAPDVAGPIEDEFKGARQAVLAGFGSIKDALKNPPQLISTGDRIVNMQGRMTKIMANIRKAVAAEDPINEAYWRKAAAKQQARISAMKGRNNADIRGIGKQVKDTGASIDGTWKQTAQQAGKSSRQARRSAISQFRSLVGDVKGLDLSSAGTNLIMSWVNAINAVKPVVDRAAANITAAFSGFFHGSAVPKHGPLKGFDRMGGDMVDAWVGAVKGRKGKVARAGAELAGAFSPRSRMPSAAMAGVGGGGDVNHFHIGTLIADEGGIDMLERRMSRRRRRRSRGGR